MHYPRVLGEEATLDLVLKGKSIARFGDGEMKIAKGGSCVSQVADKKLAEELSAILLANDKQCLVGIPTMDPEGPKYKNWARYKHIYPRQLSPKKEYVSAFISRPDSAPWINTKEYFDRMQSLWEGRAIGLVGCGERSIKGQFLLDTGAQVVGFYQCARRDAYAQIDEIEEQVIKSKLDRVILCAGPTATCLAMRLSRKGVHAIDLGHIGMFWRGYTK
jgi:hypothetical protein